MESILRGLTNDEAIGSVYFAVRLLRHKKEPKNRSIRSDEFTQNEVDTALKILTEIESNEGKRVNKLDDLVIDSYVSRLSHAVARYVGGHLKFQTRGRRLLGALRLGLSVETVDKKHKRAATSAKREKAQNNCLVSCADDIEVWISREQFWICVKQGSIIKTADYPLAGVFSGTADQLIGNDLKRNSISSHAASERKARKRADDKAH